MEEGAATAQDEAAAGAPEAIPPPNREAAEEGGSSGIPDMGEANAHYIQEGEALLARLNVTPTDDGLYSGYDAIYRDPKTGGTVYVGDIKSANTLKTLTAHGISRVVNCQGVSTRNMFEGKAKGISYYRFPVANITADLLVAAAGRRSQDPTDEVLALLGDLFTFIDDAVAGGESVLIHCLAGAHRAGTTAVCYIMHKGDLDVDHALRAAKKCRPIIDPIGHLQLFLAMYDAARTKTAKTAAPAAPGAADVVPAP